MHRGSVSGFTSFPYDFHCFQLKKHSLVFFRGLSMHGVDVLPILFISVQRTEPLSFISQTPEQKNGVDVLPFASYYGECLCGLGLRTHTHQHPAPRTKPATPNKRTVATARCRLTSPQAARPQTKPECSRSLSQMASCYSKTT